MRSQGRENSAAGKRPARLRSTLFHFRCEQSAAGVDREISQRIAAQSRHWNVEEHGNNQSGGDTHEELCRSRRRRLAGGHQLSPIPSRPTVEPMMTIPASSVTVTDWYKQDVYDPNNNKIGQVADVLVSQDGHVNALIIGVGRFPWRRSERRSRGLRRHQTDDQGQQGPFEHEHDQGCAQNGARFKI